MSTTLANLGNLAVKEHPHDIEAAVAFMVAAAERDPDVQALEDVWKEAIARGCRQVVHDVRAAKLSAVKNNAGKEELRKTTDTIHNAPEVDLEAIGAVGKSMFGSFLGSFTMPNGKVLAEWTGSELLDLTQNEREEISGRQRRVTFFEALAEKAADRMVGEVWKDSEAATLWQTIVRGESPNGKHASKPRHVNSNAMPLNPHVIGAMAGGVQ